jgi:hypothetical protein
MSRRAKTFISILTAAAVAVGFGSSAIAYYSTGAATRGDHPAVTLQGGSSSLNATVGEEGQPSGIVATSRHAQPDAGSHQVVVRRDGPQTAPFEPRPTTSAPATSTGDGFNWGDAMIGAGVALGLAVVTRSMVGLVRRRTHIEPSV